MTLFSENYNFILKNLQLYSGKIQFLTLFLQVYDFILENLKRKNFHLHSELP